MIIDGYLKKIMDIYNAIYPTVNITLSEDGFYVHNDTNDYECKTLGSFTEFIENEIKEALLSMFVNRQYTDIQDIINALNK